MLSFVNNSWDVIAGTIIFLLGLIIAIKLRKMFRISSKLAIALYLWHTLFCIIYLWVSFSRTADSTLYYLNSFYYDSEFRFGTGGIIYVVSFFTQYLDLSYGGVFLLFNITGFIGLLAFSSALRSVTINSSRNVRNFSVLIMFLPGASFWSSAIGKDPLTFLASGLATWAALDINRRIPAMVISILAFLVPRPHMAGILLISFSSALLLSANIGLAKKVVLIAIALPITVLAAQFGLSYAGLEEIAGISDYFEQRQGYNLGGGSSVDIASMPVLLRMFTYLFRPLFIDGGSLLGIVVSFENLILFSIFLFVIFRKYRTKSVVSYFTIVFYTLFAITSWFILANTTANLGIAIRQKWMFLPMLLVLAFSFWQLPRKHRQLFSRAKWRASSF